MLRQNIDITDYNKVIASWEDGKFILFINGVKVDAGIGSTFGANVITTLGLSRGDGNTTLKGKTKAIAVFDYLSDEEMIRLTK